MDAARRGLQQDASGDSRLNHIDILKGIGIILMVIGHMHYWPNFNKFIFGFHMPLFFWISGYLYHKPTNILIYAMRKVRTLLIPYFIAGLAYSFLDWFRAGWDFEELAFNLKSVFIKTTYDLPIESALWFLFALFWVTLMYAALDVCVRSGTIQILIVIVITTAGCLWTRWLHYLPWGLNSAMSALGFFALGHQYRQRVSQGKEIVFSRSTHINGKIWVGGGYSPLIWSINYAEWQSKHQDREFWHTPFKLFECPSLYFSSVSNR